eukprot:c47542_g1_i1.p1 GENE.c47542_g1_i1~~c47542_g1_i1.p1  ORF type:complete len:444 (+),score=77.27 c47542_g1_i1:128-1333(+)
MIAADPTVEDELVEVNWFHTVLLTVTPALALYGILTTPLTKVTAILAVITYFATGMGITAGYHRLFSHRAYKAGTLVRWALLLCGAAALQGSAKWWCRNHRLHHRFTDTERDPYSVRKGFWWSHCGWMLTQQDYSKSGRTHLADLTEDPAIQFQHKHYVALALGLSVGLPTLIGGAFGDAKGAFLFACMLRIVFVHHATFFVNSLAHSFGDQPYCRLNSARDSMITAVLTLGEGIHNFHHSHPCDYRNGIRWYHYDPTKWLVFALSKLGLVSALRCVDDEAIERSKDFVNLGFSQQPAQDPALPVIEPEEFHRRVAAGEALIVIEGGVYDVKPFATRHPGGYQTLMGEVGTDASAVFRGEARSADTSLNHHTQEARETLRTLAVARLNGRIRLASEVKASQ